MTTREDENFGVAFYEAVRALPGSELFRRAVKYAEIQELKAADRSAVARFCRRFSYDTVQRAKQGTPDEIARHLVELLEAQERERIARAKSWRRPGGFGWS